jgi:hypothetical protein
MKTLKQDTQWELYLIAANLRLIYDSGGLKVEYYAIVTLRWILLDHDLDYVRTIKKARQK